MLNIFVWFMIISTIASLILLERTVANYNSKRSFFLIFSSICSFMYTFGYLLEIISLSLEAAFLGVRVQKVGSLLIILFIYLFIRDVYEKKRFSLKMNFILFAIPVLNLLSAQAFPFIKLHYTGVEYFKNEFIANCHGYPGIMNYIAIIYNLVLVILSLSLILKNFNRGGKLQKQQNRLMIISILVPLFINIYHTSTYNHLRIDLNPFALSLSVALLLYSINRQNLLNAVPLARAQVIESMSDAFIVCGKDFSFLDANQAAKNLFPELNTLLPGEIMEQVKRFENENELSIQTEGELRFYKINQTPIMQNNKVSGVCILFHDITDKENQLKKLYGKATFDPLMHIYNRATFFDLAEFMLNSSDAKNKSYALLMIDLDKFKLVNDTYGHACGDIVLETIAVIVKGHFRKNDIVGRYGGEEIVVLLEDIPFEQLFIVVERLRTIVENTVISCQEKELSVTISIGMSYSNANDPHSLDDMLSKADSALYNAKNSGRNRYSLYE